MNLFSNYFFSGWIANLGVDPLFLSAAFLFAPLLLVLRFLLLSVTLVLEAILLSLSKLKNQWIFLSFSIRSVKAFLSDLAPVIGLLLSFEANAHSLFLAKGEQESIKINRLTNFSIGNPEVISVKYQEKLGQLLIKARAIGYSDLILWQENDKKIKYEIYSSSKNQQVQKLRLIKSLNAKGLKIQTGPSGIIVSGKVQNLSQYDLILKIWGQKDWIIRAALAPKFKNQLVSKIYQIILDQDATYVRCRQVDLMIFCDYTGDIPKSLIKQLSSKYIATFTQLKDTKNYQIKYQIIQINDLESSSIKLGIDQISLQLHGLLNSSIQDLDQFLKINAQNLNAKVIASPMTITGLDTNNSIELGSSIPYQDQTQFGTTTKWKFAGLKVRNMLSMQKNKLLLNYKTELSHPTGESISGSKASGSIFIQEEKFFKAFEITYESNDKIKDYIPLLGEIPILQQLFSSNSSHKGLKHIIGFIKIAKWE